ncbi:MAG TPA: hypothetical protein VL361_22115, partial [Candidatus Limnocylindrales bacterium]|nr:hypothetical protein [Candidatus Limnocylindrales bacterium]
MMTIHQKFASKREIPKCATGIAGLDQITEGGAAQRASAPNCTRDMNYGVGVGGGILWYVRLVDRGC